MSGKWTRSTRGSGTRGDRAASVAGAIARSRPEVERSRGYSATTSVGSPSPASGASGAGRARVVVLADAAERARELARVRLAAARDPRDEREQAQADAHGADPDGRGRWLDAPCRTGDEENCGISAGDIGARRGRRRRPVRGPARGGATLRRRSRRRAGRPGRPVAARAEAERLWPVSADRSLRLRPGVRGGIGTPGQGRAAQAMRWYVEPLAYDQRSFNAAALRLIDDLRSRSTGFRPRSTALRAEAAMMRIAVCRPQVPFAHGGAEIFTDALVDGAAGAGARGRPRHGAVQVVSRGARADAGVSLAAARPDRGRRQAHRHGRRDEVPLLSRPPSREARLARAPVPTGVRARRHAAGPVLADARGQGAAPAGAGARPHRARRGDAAVRHLAERRGPARALDGPRRGGAPAPAPGARVPQRRGRRLRALRQPARSSQAHRPAARGRRADTRPRGRRRG